VPLVRICFVTTAIADAYADFSFTDYVQWRLLQQIYFYIYLYLHVTR